MVFSSCDYFIKVKYFTPKPFNTKLYICFTTKTHPNLLQSIIHLLILNDLIQQLCLITRLLSVINPRVINLNLILDNFCNLVCGNFIQLICRFDNKRGFNDNYHTQN